MKICGTNLVPIFVTMVFCGIIFIYFNSRLAEVKSSVEKQNRVLTAFITNVQSDIKNGGMILGQNAFAASAGSGPASAGASVGAGVVPASANHLASEEALRAVRRNDKIVVSDDEDDDDSDSEDDDDDDDDSDSEDDDEEEDDAIIEIPSISIQELPPTSIQELPPTSIQELPATSIQELPPTSIQELPTSIQESVSLDLIQDNLTLDFASIEDYSLKVIDLDSSTAKTDIHYDQMKVDDLRKIVTDLNLIVKDEAKKLKKPELLALLKNKTA